MVKLIQWHLHSWTTKLHNIQLQTRTKWFILAQFKSSPLPFARSFGKVPEVKAWGMWEGQHWHPDLPGAAASLAVSPVMFSGGGYVCELLTNHRWAFHVTFKRTSLKRKNLEEKSGKGVRVPLLAGTLVALPLRKVLCTVFQDRLRAGWLCNSSLVSWWVWCLVLMLRRARQPLSSVCN